MLLCFMETSRLTRFLLVNYVLPKFCKFAGIDYGSSFVCRFISFYTSFSSIKIIAAIVLKKVSNGTHRFLVIGFQLQYIQ